MRDKRVENSVAAHSSTDCKERLVVVKVGGAIVEDETRLSALLSAFSAIEGRKLLVHGGGRRATKVAAAL